MSHVRARYRDGRWALIVSGRASNAELAPRSGSVWLASWLKQILWRRNGGGSMTALTACVPH
jgi:hypothetical protein